MTAYPVPEDASPPCREHPDWYFPEHGAKSKLLTEAAKNLCASCPWREGCRAYAVAHVVHGIWAGTTEEDRKAEQRARRIKPIPLTVSEALRPAVYTTPTGERQQCGQGWGPIGRHDRNREPLCDECRAFRARHRKARKAS